MANHISRTFVMTCHPPPDRAVRGLKVHEEVHIFRNGFHMDLVLFNYIYLLQVFFFFLALSPPLIRGKKY